MFLKEGTNVLVFQKQHEMLRIEPWGKNALRIRCAPYGHFNQENWSLAETSAATPIISIDNEKAFIQNGKLKAVVKDRKSVV